MIELRRTEWETPRLSLDEVATCLINNLPISVCAASDDEFRRAVDTLMPGATDEEKNTRTFGQYGRQNA